MSTDLVTQMRDYLDTIATPVTPNDVVTRPPAALPHHRQFWRGPVVALVAAVVVLLGATPLLFFGGGSAPPSDPPQPAPLQLGVEYIWPEGGFVGDAEAVALEFAAVALGWDQATVTADTAADANGPIWVAIAQPGREELSVLVAPVGEGRSALFQIGTLGGALGTDGLEEGQWIGLPAVTGAATADVHFRMAHPDLDRLVEAGPDDLELGRLLVAETGPIASVVVVYRDSGGDTITAAGGHFGPFEDQDTNPLEHPIMATATGIDAAEIPTEQLKEVMSVEPGDEIFTIPVGDFEVLARMRQGTASHLYATSCNVLIMIELPDGWDGTCLERTVDGQRVAGVFQYDDLSG